MSNIIKRIYELKRVLVIFIKKFKIFIYKKMVPKIAHYIVNPNNPR